MFVDCAEPIDVSVILMQPLVHVFLDASLLLLEPLQHLRVGGGIKHQMIHI